MAIYDYSGTEIPTGDGGGGGGGSADVTVRDYYCSFSMFPRIAVVGDSYANGYCGENSEAESGINHPLLGWPLMLARRSGSTVINYSWGGRSTRNFIANQDAGLAKLLADQPCDLYLLALQRNDYNTYHGGEETYLGDITDLTEGTFGEYPDTYYGNYGTIIESIQRNSPQSRLVLIVGDYSPNSAAYPTSVIVEEVAEHYNLPILKQRDDDYFKGDNAYYWDKPAGGHPAILAYSGMELAMERLFQKCVKKYRDYFLYYAGVDGAGALPNDLHGKVDTYQGTAASGKVLAVDSAGDVKPVAASSLLTEISETINNLWETIYPVGSIYMCTNAASPAILFGGEWERLKDRFLLGAGDTYEAGATGGAASQSYTPGGSVGSTALTADQIPSHAHGLNNHKHSVGAHSHGLNSHVHSVGAHSHGLSAHTHTIGAHTHGLNGHTHSISAHQHTFRQMLKLGGNSQYNGERLSGASPVGDNQDALVRTCNALPECTTGWGGGGTTGAASGDTAYSAAFNSGSAGGGNTANSSAFNTGAASGSTANSSPFDSGAASGNTTATGGGKGHSHTFSGAAASISTMPPYLVVNMWVRIA